MIRSLIMVVYSHSLVMAKIHLIAQSVIMHKINLSAHKAPIGYQLSPMRDGTFLWLVAALLLYTVCVCFSASKCVKVHIYTVYQDKTLSGLYRLLVVIRGPYRSNSIFTIYTTNSISQLPLTMWYEQSLSRSIIGISGLQSQSPDSTQLVAGVETAGCWPLYFLMLR